MDAVPVNAGRNGHPGDGEEFVQLIKGGRAAAPAGADHTGSHLHGLIETSAVKQSVKQGYQRGVGGSVVHRRSHHQAVGLLEFEGNLIYNVVKHAFAGFGALVAGDAAAHVLLPHLNGFAFDAFLGEHLLHFPQGNGCIAVLPRTAVEHQNLHENFLLLWIFLQYTTQEWKNQSQRQCRRTMTLRGLYRYGSSLTRPVTVLHAKPVCTRPVGADRICPQHKAPLRGACVPGRLLVDPTGCV